MTLAELAATLPPLYGTEFDQHPVARLAFYKGDATYYAVEYDPDEQCFFGLLVTDTYSDVASWTLSDLEGATQVEGFTPAPFSECLGVGALAFDELTAGLAVRWQGQDAVVKEVRTSGDPKHHRLRLVVGVALHELSRWRYSIHPCRRTS